MFNWKLLFLVYLLFPFEHGDFRYLLRGPFQFKRQILRLTRTAKKKNGWNYFCPNLIKLKITTEAFFFQTDCSLSITMREKVSTGFISFSGLTWANLADQEFVKVLAGGTMSSLDMQLFLKILLSKKG